MKHNMIKRTLAGVMAVLTVAGTVPANFVSFPLFGLTASAESTADAAVNAENIKEKEAESKKTVVVSSEEEFKAAVEKGGKFAIGKDIKLTEEYIIKSDAEIDLKGCKLTTAKEFIVEGSLTINDTVGGGKVTSESKYGAVVINDATDKKASFTFAGGTVEATKAIDKFGAVSVAEGAVFEMTGGTLKSNDIAVFCERPGGKTTISGGVVIGKFGFSEENKVGSEALSIKGGRFTADPAKYLSKESKASKKTLYWSVRPADDTIAVGKEFSVGDTITLKDQWVYLEEDIKDVKEEDLKYVKQSVSGTFTLPAPEFNDGENTERKYIKLTDAFGESYSLYLKPDSRFDKKNYDGVKIVSGEGTEKSPFVIASLYDESYVKTAAKEPDCENDGNMEYYTAIDGKYYHVEEDKFIEEKRQEIPVIPALGHSWGAPEWTWTGSDSAKAAFTCERDEEHKKELEAKVNVKLTASGEMVFTATVELDGVEYTDTRTADAPAITFEKVEAVEAACGKAGNIEYYKGSDGKNYVFKDGGYAEVSADDVVIPAAEHVYGEPTWEWNTAKSEAVAVFECKNKDDKQTVNAKVTSKQTVYATYENEGKIVYTATATFEGKEYTDTVEVTVPKNTLTHVEAVEPTCTKDGNLEYWWDLMTLRFYEDPECKTETTIFKMTLPKTGHKGSDPEFIWNEDNTADIKYTCEVCGEVITDDAEVTAKKTAPSYSADGKVVYTATAKLDGKTYTDTKEVTVSKPAPVDVTYHAGSKCVQLNWNAVEGADKYAVCSIVNGKWQIITEGYGTSYLLKGLEAGQEYQVAVIPKVGGMWCKDFTHAATVAAAPEVPTVNAQVRDGRIQLEWSAVKGAEKFGVAVYRSGKWVIMGSVDAEETSYISPEIRNGKYKMVVCAKVNGKWDTRNLNDRAFEITVK